MRDELAPGIVLRDAVIRRLIHAAADAMCEVCDQDDASASEVFSAYLTMAKTAIRTAMLHGASPETCRHAIEQLLVECVDPTKPQ